MTTSSLAQTPGPTDARTEVAAAGESAPAAAVPAARASSVSSPPSSPRNPAAPDLATADPAAHDLGAQLAIEKELAAMKLRIEQLQQELAEMKGHAAGTQPAASNPASGATAPAVATAFSAAPANAGLGGWLAQPSTSPSSGRTRAASAASAALPGQAADAAPAKKEKIAPFSDWDWTWLNGNPRNKDTGFQILHPRNPRRCHLQLRFQQTRRQLHGGIERTVSLERNSARATRPGRRLPL
ncbi:MAG: hypothetical protein ABSF59_15555 [Candidatus Sulfotelmatobacter sp.]